MSSTRPVMRRVLCVYPRNTTVYPNFTYAFRFFPKTRALMPPQGLLILAAYLPKRWEVRFIDEAVRPADDEDYRWADVVMTSGTHSQRHLLDAIAERAHRFGKLAVIGGPAASACPEHYPSFDMVHVGELGDATDALVAALEESAARPPEQRVFTTVNRLPLEDFPLPAYHLIRAANYLLLNTQWSSGCPFTCEFCDIPELYGRNPRFKSPERLLRELDAILAQKPLGAVFFVDDNLIGNKKAFKQLLPHLIAWQERTGRQLRFIGECTLNLGHDEEILGMMREAGFIEIFIGVESAEVEALVAMGKKQNMRMPMVEAIRRINKYGISVTAGLILGLDTDTDQTVENVLAFIEETRVPMAIINTLYAPPRTPLWRRLEAEGRLIPQEEVVVSNIAFKEGAAVVEERYREAIDRCYEPSAVFARFAYQAEHTHTRRVKASLPPLSSDTLLSFVYALGAMVYHVGVKASYRREFWGLASQLLPRGQIDSLVNYAAVGYHMICYRDDVLAGVAQSCIHTEAAPPLSTAPRPAAPSPSPIPLRRKPSLPVVTRSSPIE